MPLTEYSLLEFRCMLNGVYPRVGGSL